jgi:hypothetical protein
MNKFLGFYSLLKHLVGARRAQYTDYGTVRVTGNGGLILGKTRDFFSFAQCLDQLWGILCCTVGSVSHRVKWQKS